MHTVWQSHLGTLHTWQPPRCSYNMVTNAIPIPAVRLPGSKDPLLVGPQGHTQSGLCSYHLCDLCFLIRHPTRDSRTGHEDEAQDTSRLVTRYPTATEHDIHPAPPRVNPQRELTAHSVDTFPNICLVLKKSFRFFLSTLCCYTVSNWF